MTPHEPETNDAKRGWQDRLRRILSDDAWSCCSAEMLRAVKNYKQLLNCCCSCYHLGLLHKWIFWGTPFMDKPVWTNGDRSDSLGSSQCDWLESFQELDSDDGSGASNCWGWQVAHRQVSPWWLCSPGDLRKIAPKQRRDRPLWRKASWDGCALLMGPLNVAPGYAMCLNMFYAASYSCFHLMHLWKRTLKLKVVYSKMIPFDKVMRAFHVHLFHDCLSPSYPLAMVVHHISAIAQKGLLSILSCQVPPQPLRPEWRLDSRSRSWSSQVETL